MLGLGAEFLFGMLSLGLVIQLGAGSPPQPLDCLLMLLPPPQRTVCLLPQSARLFRTESLMGVTL